MNAVTKTSPEDLRQALHALTERLPEAATWMDVEGYMRFRAAVAEGRADPGVFAGRK
jgi:hypothetical protein